MKTEDLMDCIGQTDDKLILEADVNSITTHPATRSWIKSAAAAAAVCLLAAIPFVKGRLSPPPDYSDLPKLSVNADSITLGGGMGFEGHMAYDISELANGNPWTEKSSLKTLPVFRNTRRWDENGFPVNGLSPEEMLAETEKIAKLLGLEVLSRYTLPQAEPEPTTVQIAPVPSEPMPEPREKYDPNTRIYQANADCKGAAIAVHDSGHIVLTLTPETVGLAKDLGKLKAYSSFSVNFDFGTELADHTDYEKGMPLPNGFRFAFENTSREQAAEITAYLFAQYGSFADIKKPGYDLFADYNIYGALIRLNTTVFENAGSLTERILNYHFNGLSFSASDLGGLSAIRYGKTDLSQKIGDYPIITAAKARKLLLENHYITTVTEKFPGEEYIANAELMYRVHGREAIFMPYYKFLVELPSMARGNGMKDFGVYYVPAVQSAFLENLPVWDGSFN